MSPADDVRQTALGMISIGVKLERPLVADQTGETDNTAAFDALQRIGQRRDLDEFEHLFDARWQGGTHRASDGSVVDEKRDRHRSRGAYPRSSDARFRTQHLGDRAERLSR